LLSDKGLVPIEQKAVQFYGDELTAVRTKAGMVYIPVRPICQLLGVSWPSQRNRILRDPVLSDAAHNISVFVTNTQGQGQHRDMLSLPLDFVSGFLFGINATRVKEDLKERLIRYQRECYQVLSEAFQEGRLTADPTFDELLLADSPAAQAYKMASAIMQMARQQLLLESELKNQATQLADHEKRLEQVEAALGDPGQNVTPDQAMQISQAVKTIAMVLSKATGTNQYGSVYGQLYRKFGITSYKLLPANRFPEAMEFLTDWHQNLVGDVPF
jgi:hypothetical protein